MEDKLSYLIDKAKSYHEQLPPKVVISGLPKFSSYLDASLHSSEATPVVIKGLCADAVKYQFATVFTNPIFVPLVKECLAGSSVRVGTVAGFPLGAYPTNIKVAEARAYINAGADEIDMVMSVGMLKAGDYQLIFDDIKAMAEEVHSHNKLLKVIIEAVLLTKYEKILSCLICQAAGADFVKTSTGFSKGGATVEDVDLMRRVVGPEMGVKAAGGIHHLNEALAMIKAGANRLGTSAAVRIIKEYQQKKAIKGA